MGNHAGPSSPRRRSGRSTAGVHALLLMCGGLALALLASGTAVDARTAPAPASVTAAAPAAAPAAATAAAQVTAEPAAPAPAAAPALVTAAAPSDPPVAAASVPAVPHATVASTLSDPPATVAPSRPDPPAAVAPTRPDPPATVASTRPDPPAAVESTGGVDGSSTPASTSPATPAQPIADADPAPDPAVHDGAISGLVTGSGRFTSGSGAARGIDVVTELEPTGSDCPSGPRIEGLAPGICPPVPDGVPHCQPIEVLFEHSVLLGYPGSDVSSVTTIDPPCGRYLLELRSIDVRHGAGYQIDQTEEQWFLEGLDASHQVIYTSPPTPDLADTETGATFVVGEVVLDGVVSFRARHLGSGLEAQSIGAAALLIPVG